MRFASVIIFMLLWGGSSLLIFKNWEAEQQEYLKESALLLKTTYLASVGRFQVATQILYEDVIKHPEVIATVAEGMLGTTTRTSLARGRLYRLLAPAYSHLKKHGVQELQFHTADGHSFLRFHAPEKFGDPLFDIRPSVLLTNRQKRPTHGFEVDRLAAGLKYVFPLFQEKQHLGSVEASVSFRSISEAMAGIDPGREYLLLLRKEKLGNALFPEQRALYDTSPIHRSFLVEDADLRLPVSPPALSENVQKLNTLLKEDPRVADGLSAGQAFSLAVSVESADWAVSFEPIKDLFGENVACIVAYSRAPYLTDLRRNLLFTLALTSLAFIGLFWLTLRLMKAHTDLRREKLHLQIITDTIGDGLCVMDTKGHVVQINPAFTELLGYREDEVLGKIGHDLFHVHESGGTIPFAQCPIISAMQKGSTYSGEEIFRHKDGRLVSVEIVCKPFIKESRVEGSVNAFRDITERKLTQKRLTEATGLTTEALNQVKFERDKTLSILEAMADGISIQDPELRVTYQNAAHRKRMGDHLGEFCYQAYQGREDICPGCHLMQSFDDGQLHIRETTASPAGELRHFQIASTPLYDSSGKLVAGIESVRDITTRVQAEEKLQKKTLELEEANRELEAFSYTLSHDLRSYLSCINLSGETLQELGAERLDDDSRYLLEKILTSCESMETLIATMLTLAHISQQELQPEEINLSAMAEQICGKLAESSPNRFLRFRITPGIKVRGDSRLMRVVMENLLGNACKYTREKPEAIISFTSRQQEGKRIIAIADNGTGFDMNEVAKLFLPFQRLSSARSFPGFGIGLTTVERIIKRHGGEIWAEATPGEGATFHFTLPG